MLILIFETGSNHMPFASCVDDPSDPASGSLPGQPLLQQSGQSLPWDPGSPSARWQLDTEALESPDLSRRRPARTQQAYQEEDQVPYVPSRAVQDQFRPERSRLPDASDQGRQRPLGRTGFRETQPTLRPNDARKPNASGTTSMTDQLKVLVVATSCYPVQLPSSKHKTLRTECCQPVYLRHSLLLKCCSTLAALPTINKHACI